MILDTIKDVDMATVFEWTGEQVAQRIMLIRKAKVYASYEEGMLLFKALSDFDKGKADSYSAPTFDEWVADFYQDKYSARKKIDDFLFMQDCINKGIPSEEILELQQADQIREVRRHVQATEKEEDVEYIREQLAIASELKREYRKHRKSIESGEITKPIEVEKLSLPQAKALAYDKSLACMRALVDDNDSQGAPMGLARIDAYKECIKIMIDCLNESKEK